MSRIDPDLAAPRGENLKAILVARVSKAKKEATSLEDQEHNLRRVVGDNHDGPVDWTVLASEGSGEHLDRAELDKLEELLESREYDLVITEDLGRIARRSRAFDICELAEDCGVRLIAINDGVDNGREDWRTRAFFSVLRHEMYKKDTSARIRRRQRNRFVTGGMVQCVLPGYVKEPGVKTDDKVYKDPAAEPVYDRVFTLLEQGASFADVADYLNTIKSPLGGNRCSKHWTACRVAHVVRNPILKGLRIRNLKIANRINKTGRHRSVPAPPEERLERQCPHRAFIDPEPYCRSSAVTTAFGRSRCCWMKTPAITPRTRRGWPLSRASG